MSRISLAFFYSCHSSFMPLVFKHFTLLLQEIIHQRMPFLEDQGIFTLRDALVVGHRPVFALRPTVVNDEGYGLVRMSPALEWRRMVRKRQDTILVELFHPVNDVANDILIKVCDGLELVFKIAGVARFIRRFHMYVDNILCLESPKRMLGLSNVISIDPAGGARYVDHLETSIDADTFGKVHGRDHGPFEAVFLFEGRHARPPPLPPEPYAVRRTLAVLDPGFISWMVQEQVRRRLHQGIKDFVSFSARKVVLYILVLDIVRRRTIDLILAPFPDHEVAVTHAGIETDTVATELAVDLLDKQTGLLRGDMTCAEIFHDHTPRRARC